jgi:hypothetical protein
MCHVLTLHAAFIGAIGAYMAHKREYTRLYLRLRLFLRVVVKHNSASARLQRYFEMTYGQITQRTILLHRFWLANGCSFLNLSARPLHLSASIPRPTFRWVQQNHYNCTRNARQRRNITKRWENMVGITDEPRHNNGPAVNSFLFRRKLWTISIPPIFQISCHFHTMLYSYIRIQRIA